MKAHEYQYLLNKIYCAGFVQEQKMNADSYLKMQQEYNNLKAFEAAADQAEQDYAFRKSFLIVRNYVHQAIKDGLRSFQVNMQTDDIDKLSVMATMLNRNFFDKNGLDQIITTANRVFKQYNLKN